MRSYLRPVGLSYGVRHGRRLAGSDWISFAAAEVITRQSSMVVDCRDLADSAAIEAPRASYAGLALDPLLVVGIVNVTPDSFSDGGLHAETSAAIAHGLKLAEEDADILDVGGESTRPGSDGVSEQEELDRVIPVIEALSRAGHVVSCDTRKASVMSAAVSAGARIINDVSALQHDPAALATVAALGCPVILMHAQGDPRTMQLSPTYENVALDVYDALEARIAACIAAGISRGNIAIDPGIGFGKSFRHNLEILHQLTLFHGLGVPLMVGLSRKAFIGALTGEKLAKDRVHGSVGGAVHAMLNGAQMLRVHDVRATVAALAVARAVADPASSGI